MDVPPFYMFEFPFENGYFSTQSTKIQQTLPWLKYTLKDAAYLP